MDVPNHVPTVALLVARDVRLNVMRDVLMHVMAVKVHVLQYAHLDVVWIAIQRAVMFVDHRVLLHVEDALMNALKIAVAVQKHALQIATMDVFHRALVNVRKLVQGHAVHNVMVLV